MLNKISTFYNQEYYAPTITTSMRKLPLIAKQIEDKEISQLHNPYLTIDKDYVIECLLKLHNPQYVKDFLNGTGKCSSNGWDWTEQIKEGVLALTAGQIAGAKMAFDKGISANIYAGAHHAKYDSGGGFCTFNGLALVAQEFPDKKIMILDCDEHQGDGTMDFIHRLPNLYNYSIYGTEMDGAVRYDVAERHRDVYLHKPRFGQYRDALMVALATAQADWKPDLIIYQAGVDCHVNDPLGTLDLTTDHLFMRDELVFEFCRDFEIPILFVMAGGYDDEAVSLHTNTFKAAHEKYNLPVNRNQWKIEAVEYMATLKK